MLAADKTGNTSPVFEATYKTAHINNDKTVDIKDITAIASSYNTQKNSPGWNENYELNSDREVNLYDLVNAA